MFLKKFVNIFSKTLIFSQGQRDNWCIPKDLFKMLTGDWREGKFFFKQDMQNQLISEDWRFLYVFLPRLLQAIWIHLLQRSNQIALCLLATAFWHMPHGNWTIVVVMVCCKISSDDRVGIAVSVVIAQF